MTRTLTTTLATLTIALLLFTAGSWYGTARTLSREREADSTLALRHAIADAEREVGCMVVYAWAKRWQYAGMARAEAQFGLTGHTKLEGE